MIKSAELSNPNSCMSRAHDDEMTFVLLGRDVAAPWTIRFWAAERIRLGKNNPFDPQILEAYACAASMEASAKPPQKSQTVSNLIGAASDMYEALEALWLEIGKYENIGHEGSNLLEVMSDARVALAKARGERWAMLCPIPRGGQS